MEYTWNLQTTIAGLALTVVARFWGLARLWFRMKDSNVKFAVGIIRSKLFLLFLILLLCGFIYSHLSTSRVAGINIGVVTRPLKLPASVRQSAFRDNLGHVFRDGGLFSESLQKTVLKNTLGRSVNISGRSESVDLHIESADDVEISESGRNFESGSTGQKCKKKTNVSFLKVHKAGSTTVMNIFLRFAISNKLNIVLPPETNGFGFNYLGYGRTVSREHIVPLPNNETYNILCNHVVYNREAFRDVMPEDTMYVGILREPTSHFKSAALYYGFYNHLKQYALEHNLNQELSVISEFLKKPGDFQVGTSFVYNRMSFDFGVPTSQFHNASFVQQYVQELDRDYSLLMILERFYESLVLLRRLLCWATKDILYVPLNTRDRPAGFSLSPTDVNHLKQWNSADFMLYEHFSFVFDHRVKDEGTDFLEEVESFKNIQEMVKEFCVSHSSAFQNLSVPETKWDSSFTVTREDCDLMTEDELPMMKRLIEDAWQHYSASKGEASEQYKHESDIQEMSVSEDQH